MMDKYIGRLLDNRYEVMTLIGIGGMAVVYKALDHRLNRQVALKILKDDYSGDAEFRRRFHAESQAVAMLNHPNIVSVYDVSTDGDADYIVMELVDGITLKQYIERRGGYLNWKESLHFASQIAKALEHAHNQGVIHRDIKPHNVMILKNGSAKVTDFGIARMMSAQNTLTKEALGSVHYISPEQAKGGRVDNRSDIYSLGVVMYEMITGQPPYDGESPVAVALQHINGGARMPSILNPNLPGGLEQIIMKAMAVDPAQRFSSATELLDDMEEFRKNPNILFSYNRSGEKLTLPPVVHEPPKTTTQTGTQRPTRTGNTQTEPKKTTRTRVQPEPEEDDEDDKNRFLMIAVGVVGAIAVVLLIVLLFFWAKGGSKDNTPLVDVPNLVNKDFETAKTQYAYLNLRDDEYQFSDDYEAGRIISQNPAAYERVAQGTVIHLVVSNGPLTGQMPNLADRTEEQARKTLDSMTDLRLVITTVEEESDKFDAGRVIRTEPDVDSTLRTGQTIVLYISAGPLTSEMPDVVNKPKDAAETILRNLKGMDLQVFFNEEPSTEIDKGRVTRTEPEAGTTLKSGDPVVIYVSSGPVKMPDVVGKSQAMAESMLQNLEGVKLDIRVQTESSDTVEKDKVIRTSPEAGITLKKDQQVTLYVSTGPKTTRVPNVVGLDVSKAISALSEAHLRYDYEPVESDLPKDQVISQTPGKDEEVPENTVIKLTISKGPKETEPVEVSKTVTLVLPTGITTNYKIQLYKGGSPVTEVMTVEPDSSTELQVSLSGVGIQYFDFYVNGEYKDVFRVNFDAPGSEKIQLVFTVNG